MTEALQITGAVAIALVALGLIISYIQLIGWVNEIHEEICGEEEEK